MRPLAATSRTASSLNSFVNHLCFVIEFAFHLRGTLYFSGANPLSIVDDSDFEAVQAASITSRLIESVTIYPDERAGPATEVVASVASLVAYALNADAARGGGVWCVALVAGAGFEPAAFRL